MGLAFLLKQMGSGTETAIVGSLAESRAFSLAVLLLWPFHRTFWVVLHQPLKAFCQNEKTTTTTNIYLLWEGVVFGIENNPYDSFSVN